MSISNTEKYKIEYPNNLSDDNKFQDLKNTYKNLNCIKWQKNYLSKVCIYEKNNCKNLCSNNNFFYQLFNLNIFYNLDETESAIKRITLEHKITHSEYDLESQFLKDKWKSCEKKCFIELSDLISNEINSTAYNLRLLSNSLISINKDNKIKFEYNNNKLTGLWKDDYLHFKIINLNKNKNSKIIFGFGPSASGKTYWANNIIKLFNNNDSTFPENFISIDGGLQRELSETYQYIIKHLHKNNIGGFNNLVTAGLGHSKSLFAASKIKKNLINYLKTQENISLYVPITLGGCLKKWCAKDYQKYINLVDDKKWIGLLIFQHKTGFDCPYKEEFRCVGCRESGIKRENYEGKKYSSLAYYNSMINGLEAIKKATGGSFEIHNTGGYKYKNLNGEELFAKSIIKEHAINSKYIFDSIPDKFNSVYIQV